MKRSLSFGSRRATVLVVVGTCLVAGTYGLVRLAYGLFLPDIQASVDLGPAVAGYVSSAASASYCLGALVGVVAGDRPRLLVVGAFATASAGALGMALAPGTGSLVPAVVLASAGAGLASPGMVAVVGRSLRADLVDRAQATVNSGTGPGLVGAGVLALVVPDWRAGFAISAALTAAAGIGVLVLDRGATPSRAPGERPARPGTSPGSPRWLAALARPLAGSLLLGAASATVWTYGRSHLVAAGASDTGSVLAWIALGLGGAATALTAGALSRRAATCAWSSAAVVVAGAVVTLAAPGWLPAAVVACTAFGWAFVAATSALIAWVGERAPGREAAGTSAVFIALVLGQAVGSAAAGAVADRAGLGFAFLGAGVAALAAAACGWRPTAGRRPAGRPARSTGPVVDPR